MFKYYDFMNDKLYTVEPRLSKPLLYEPSVIQTIINVSEHENSYLAG